MLKTEEKLMRGRRIKEMHRIVEQLKPKYRLLEEMRCLKELSYEEISEELELSLGTRKVQLAAHMS
tara:strand:- start:136 stop:333 length:198 start_codon:yes stop_codon:yes gene_type:complete